MYIDYFNNICLTTSKTNNFSDLILPQKMPEKN